MNPMVGLGLILALALALSGCPSEVAGCQDNGECPAGHVCLNHRCEQTCELDRQCSLDGDVCDGRLCVPGTRQRPIISAVSGSSNQLCVPQGGGDPRASSGACLGSGFMVKGDNLFPGTEFKIRSLRNQETAYAMRLGSVASATQVEIRPVLPDNLRDLHAGEYVLVATNAADTTEAPISLLKGEKGEKGDRGTDGTDGLSARLYHYRCSADEQCTPPPDDVPARADDRMHVTLRGSTTAAAAVSLDLAMMDALCADVDGCTITLGLTNWKFDRGEQGVYVARATFAGAPCRIYVKRDTQAPWQRHWTVSSACVQWYATWRPNNRGQPVWTAADPQGPGLFTPYYSGQAGLDGDDVPLHLLNLMGACYLSETVPQGPQALSPQDYASQVGGELPQSDDEGFFLIASHPAWGGALYPNCSLGDNTTRGNQQACAQYWDFSDPTRSCELTIQD